MRIEGCNERYDTWEEAHRKFSSGLRFTIVYKLVQTELMVLSPIPSYPLCLIGEHGDIVNKNSFLKIFIDLYTVPLYVISHLCAFGAIKKKFFVKPGVSIRLA
jgi:hypothetical protein